MPSSDAQQLTHSREKAINVTSSEGCWRYWGQDACMFKQAWVARPRGWCWMGWEGWFSWFCQQLFSSCEQVPMFPPGVWDIHCWLISDVSGVWLWCDRHEGGIICKLDIHSWLQLAFGDMWLWCDHRQGRSSANWLQCLEGCMITSGRSNVYIRKGGGLVLISGVVWLV